MTYFAERNYALQIGGSNAKLLHNVATRSITKHLQVAHFKSKTTRSICLLQTRFLNNAHHPFDKIPEPNNLVSWTSLISALSLHQRSSEQALVFASLMRNLGIQPDSYILVCLIRASSNLGWIFYGQQLHSYIIRSGNLANIFVSTSLVSMYVKLDLIYDAHQAFVSIPQPNVVSWNSLISGYVQCGQCLRALGLVSELIKSDLRPDLFTFTNAFAACSQLSFLNFGKTTHGCIVKFGFELSVVVGNCLVDMYGKCGFVEYAIFAFKEMKDKDVVSWNSVIEASVRNQRIDLASRFLHQMPVPDTISYNQVINGIAQFGRMEDALQILFKMPNPNTSSWNSIIAGYIKRDRALEALDFLSKMHSCGVKKDDFTFSSVLRGIAGLSALKWGTLVHCCIVVSGLDSCVVVGSALIDMYSKCGRISGAEMIFNSLPKKNLVSWNALISGYAQNGNAREVLRRFKQMKRVHGLRPDHITFVSVLSACGQSGGLLLHLGFRYFESMIEELGIDPTAEHCSCMINLLAQGGDLLRAQEMIYELGFESCGLVWKALLGACRFCGDLKVAERAAARVLELEGDDEFVYVVLSNIYASHGRWSDVCNVRELMKLRGLRKEVGCSWIEVQNVVPIN